MADFEELLSKLRNPGDDGPGETIYDDLNAAYNDRVSAGDAKVSELSTANETSAAEIARLKAHNYDLLSSVSKGNPSTPTSGTAQDDNSGDEAVASLADIITFS
jgi:hypothetical protein